jgi:UDP-N-acetylglucosamine diphosphorylase/glucosamine-1-phosphate N-acetyltransferase
MKQAVILAAGEGLRIRPFTVNRPKAMISIAGKPIIQYVLEALAENGVRDIIIVGGYQKEQIFSHIGDGSRFGVKVRYVSQDRQLGTAHALLQAREAAGDEFLVLSGNKLIESDTIARFVGAASPSMLITRVEDPSRYSVVTFKDGKLVGMVDKPARPENNYINAGVYAFNKSFFNHIGTALNIPDVICDMLAHREPVNVVETDKTWLDVVYPWDILSLNSTVLQNISSSQNGTIESGVTIQGNVQIGRDTVIHAGTYITGPVMIGKGCEIGPGVCIYPATSLADNVTIQPFSVVKNSVIEDDVHIDTCSTIQDSIIDQGCRIGPHFCACSGESLVRIDEQCYKVKMGSLLGKSCQIGSMVTAQAGSIVGNFSQIKPLKVISGGIPDRSMVV